jgi:uncharacterized protein YecT (DUF1311 family)
MLTVISVLIAIISLASPTPQSTLTPPHGDSHCWDRAMTQFAMDVCASKNAHDADAAMNVVYEQLLKRAPDAEARKKLESAQNAWLAYRKAELAAKYPADDKMKYGTVYPMCFDLDIVTMTNARTAELKELLVTREGNVCAGGYATFVNN